MHAREVWESDAPGPRLARLALIPAAGLYALGWEAYRAMYRSGIKRATAPHHPILCVGNLTVGGSGKTPLTLHVADILRIMGRTVVIGASGYGAPRAEAASLAPDGPLAASQWGDEPAMIRWLRPDIPLVVGRRRVLAAALVHERYPDAVLLMDDGFQHLPLRKDTTILLDDPNPANRWCLPAGPYREPRRHRVIADLVVPGDFRTLTTPLQFFAGSGDIARIPSRYALLCALARPEGFRRAVVAATGSEPEPSVFLPDHDPMRAGTLWDRLPADRPVVVTAKDWVKLRERTHVEGRLILIARQDVSVEPAEEFRAWLEARLAKNEDGSRAP